MGLEKCEFQKSRLGCGYVYIDDRYRAERPHPIFHPPHKGAEKKFSGIKHKKCFLILAFFVIFMIKTYTDSGNFSGNFSYYFIEFILSKIK